MGKLIEKRKGNKKEKNEGLDIGGNKGRKKKVGR